MSLVSGFFRVVVALAMIVAVIAIGVLLYFALSSVLRAPEATGTKSAEPVMFTISPGESVTEVAENLRDAGLIDSPLLFRLKMQMRGDKDTLKAGEFQLTPGMDMDKLIDTLSTPPAELGVRFQVIEGMRLEEMAEKLGAEGIVDKDRFLQLTTTPDGAAALGGDFLTEAGKPPDQGLQGYLFPDTYEIKQDEEDKSAAVARLMLQTMEEKLTPEIRRALAERGQTIHQLLTVASIVQREGVVPDELPTIASVYWNRVEQGMHLGADPTTQYALGKPGEWWPELLLDPNTVDNPYNTYRFIGLPPGPICSPGMPAIEAAAFPAETPYLYFVAKNDGTGAHAFAETLEEHELNRKIYGNKQ